jgi:TatD DNase family protein
MTVHCLKAWDPLFEAMEAASAWPEKFLMHSFGGSFEVAERLLKKGAWFSFSGHFLHPRKAKVLEVFRKLPISRVLLETDAPDMMPPQEFIQIPVPHDVNHPANLAGIAEAYGRGDVLEKIAENGRRFWGF